MNKYLRETSRRITSKIVSVLYEWLVSQPDSTDEWTGLRIPERSMHLMQPCCLNRGSVFLGPQWDCGVDLQGWKLQHLLRYLAQMLSHSHSKECFPKFIQHLLYFSLDLLCSCDWAAVKRHGRIFYYHFISGSFHYPFVSFYYPFTTIIPSGIYIKNGFMPLHTVVAHLQFELSTQPKVL